EVRPLALGPSLGTRGHRFHTFGYPAPLPVEGMHGYGQIGDRVSVDGSELLQVTGASEVTRGFSGGPVFDETARRVIGMVTVITGPDRDGRLDRTAFAIPTETLRGVCAELEVSAVCPDGAAVGRGHRPTDRRAVERRRQRRARGDVQPRRQHDRLCR
ncbi:MAG: hypothetical protein ACRDYA_22395, partial [Egibacteraceae bacterium]